MAERLKIWELLSKKDGDCLCKDEAALLEDLLQQPENQAAISAYQRLKKYWNHIEEAPGSKSDEALWARHKAQFLKRYLRPEKSDDFNEVLGYEVNDGVNDESGIQSKSTDGASESTSGDAPEKRLLPRGVSRIRIRTWLRVAAIVVTVIGTGLLWQYIAKQNRVEHELAITVKNGTQKHITLPDGSQVWLNSGSKLHYDKNLLTNKVREVTLSGEAFFDIQHDPEHNFIIHTAYIDIKDIGTRFNVKAYPEDDKVETTLLNGEVEVYRRDAPTRIVRLKPNEKMVFNARLLKGSDDPASSPGGANSDPLDSITNSRIRNEKLGFSVSKVQPQIKEAGDSMLIETAWLKHQLVFNAQPFTRLAKDMERWYDVKIQFESDVYGNYIFSGIFKGETVQEALSELQMIQHFEFEQKGKNIRIY